MKHRIKQSLFATIFLATSLLGLILFPIWLIIYILTEFNWFEITMDCLEGTLPETKTSARV